MGLSPSGDSAQRVQLKLLQELLIDRVQLLAAISELIFTQAVDHVFFLLDVGQWAANHLSQLPIATSVLAFDFTLLSFSNIVSVLSFVCLVSKKSVAYSKRAKKFLIILVKVGIVAQKLKSGRRFIKFATKIAEVTPKLVLGKFVLQFGALFLVMLRPVLFLKESLTNEALDQVCRSAITFFL